MTASRIRRALCALLAATLILSAAPLALAESGNPFDVPEAFESSGNPFGSAEAATPVPAATATPAPNANDLFNLGTPDPAIGSVPNADPFGVGPTAVPGSDAFATSMPTSIPGYNPFDPDSYAQQPAVPANMVMYVVASQAQIRRSASDGARVIARVPFGEQLSVSATQNDWARVTSGKRSGYCRLDQLSSSNPNTLSRTMYVQPKRIALYRTPDRKGGQYRQLRAGETVTMTAISSDGLWARVSDGARFGFVPCFALDDLPASQGAAMWCAAISTPVMVNPDGWVQIGSLSLGQSVQLVSYLEDNTIAKIRSGSGYVAYCAASALSASDPLSLNATVYAQVSGKIMYHSPSESAHAGSIGKNARMTLIGTDSTQSWAVVRFGGRRYYTPYVFVGPARPGNGYRVVTVTENASLYRNGTEILATLPTGTRLYLLESSGTAAKVQTISDGTAPVSTGYVMLQFLKAE